VLRVCVSTCAPTLPQFHLWVLDLSVRSGVFSKNVWHTDLFLWVLLKEFVVYEATQNIPRDH
jgi:hypothetical protein